jgi:phospholipid transport system substrate-binding protein
MVKEVAASMAVGVALAAGTAWAGPATDQVKGSVEQVLKIVQDPQLKQPRNAAKRRPRIREVARGLFNFEAMTQDALGRHWKERTPEQRKHFTELFTDLLESSYVGRIESYSGEKIVYLSELTDEGDTVTVRSKVVTQRDTEIPLDYRMRKNGPRWEAFDVLIERVSLVANYRTQFNKIITQSSYEELVKKLEQKQLEVAEEQRTRKGAPWRQ